MLYYVIQSKIMILRKMWSYYNLIKNILNSNRNSKIQK